MQQHNYWTKNQNTLQNTENYDETKDFKDYLVWDRPKVGVTNINNSVNFFEIWFLSPL